MEERQKQAAKDEVISFDLPAEHAKAIDALAGSRKIRLSGELRGGRLVIDSLAFADEAFSEPLFVAVNAPFKSVATPAG